MREILFRGKTINGNEWVVGAGVYKSEGYTWIITDDVTKTENRGTGSDAIIPESVSEFTGLTDKNGKKIFEGDVVKFTSSPFGYSYTGVACFNEGSFCIKYEYWKKEKFHRIGQIDEWQDMGASGIVTYQYEILGNIHDNPELLETP